MNELDVSNSRPPGFACILLLLLAIFFPSSVFGFEAREGHFDFESTGTLNGGASATWDVAPNGTAELDTANPYRGKSALRIERIPGARGELMTVARSMDMNFRGHWLELRGAIRTEGVVGWAGLWLRQDGGSGVLKLDNMHDRAISGNTGWRRVHIRQALDPRTRQLAVGVLLVGSGRVWVDDMEIKVDGMSLEKAGHRKLSAAERDNLLSPVTQSKFDLPKLTIDQARNIAALGKVWGFLKYHHPSIRKGSLPWDAEFFRLLPEIARANSADARNELLLSWIESLPMVPCVRCVERPSNAHVLPSLSWIEDESALGPLVSRRLQFIYKNRPGDSDQFFVDLSVEPGNPHFGREEDYNDLVGLDAGFRILAIVRLWNVVNYWFPYRDLISADWDLVLEEYLLKVAEARTDDEYKLVLLQLLAEMEDGHARLLSEVDLRPPFGACRLPFAIRMIEAHPTVSVVGDDHEGVLPGDIIETLDGHPVDVLLDAWRPYHAGATNGARQGSLMRQMTRAECKKTVQLGVERQGRDITFSIVPIKRSSVVDVRDRAGNTVQWLSDTIAYVKLSQMRLSEISSIINEIMPSEATIIDIRGYPKEPVGYSFGQHLFDRPTAIARFTKADPRNPGLFYFTKPLVLHPVKPRYPGRLAILVDDSTVSQAEFTAMIFQASSNAIVVGSSTAGTDGNVSLLPLPGGLQVAMSGIGVFYPDKTATQKLGIVPDVLVAPSLAGVRRGSDEVLEAAMRHLQAAH